MRLLTASALAILLVAVTLTSSASARRNNGRVPSRTGGGRGSGGRGTGAPGKGRPRPSSQRPTRGISRTNVLPDAASLGSVPAAPSSRRGRRPGNGAGKPSSNGRPRENSRRTNPHRHRYGRRPGGSKQKVSSRTGDYDYEIIYGYDADVAEAFSQCDFGDGGLGESDRDHHHDENASEMDFTVAVSIPTSMENTALLSDAFNGEVNEETFWANFVLGAETFKQTGDDSFKLLGVSLAGITVDIDFRDHDYDGENLCSAKRVKVTSDDFDFKIKTEVATKFEQFDDGSIVFYLTQLNCGVPRRRGRWGAGRLSIEDLAIAYEMCAGDLMQMLGAYLEGSVTCGPSYLSGGQAAFLACYEQYAAAYAAAIADASADATDATEGTDDATTNVGEMGV